MNRLSSASTFGHKVVFPALFVGLVGGVNLVFLLRGSPLSVFAVATLLLGGALCWFLGIRFKQVSLDGDDLVISNFLREARVPVPVAALVRVRGGGFATRPEIICLEFDRDTSFGRSIVFTPRWRFFALGVHPVVEDLETALRRVRTLAAVRAKRAQRDAG